MLAAARAGIGICVLARSRVPADLRILTGRFDLPVLADVEMALLANPQATRGAGRGTQPGDREPAARPDASLRKPCAYAVE